MKVVMLCKWSTDVLSGGVAVHVTNLVKELSKIEDLNLSVISFGESSEVLYEGNTKIILIKAHKIYYLIPFLAIIKLALEVRKIKPDIIHVQGSNISPYLFYMLIVRGYKKIVTYHSYPSRELVGQGRLKVNSLKYRFLRFIESYTAKKTDYNITVDTRLKKWIIEKFGSQLKLKITVILNGADIDRFDYKIDHMIKKSEINLEKKTLVIFHAKAFVPKNGQEYLIRAMPEISRQIPNAILVLAGDGPLKQKMIELSDNLGVLEKIRFEGDIPNENIPNYMAAADLVVVPSVHINDLEEASSILLVEAMAMKKPVIATGIGGLKESIVEGMNGILIPDKDPAAIARAVCDVLNDPILADKLGENAFKYVKKERTWQKIALETFQVYKKLVN
ncbi:MAG: glycosyltransferase family 4 protein [Methanobacterium sp.]